MEPEFDKEMDALLRWHREAARGQRSSGGATTPLSLASGVPSRSSSDGRTNVHLDVDELSAYAENVLPVAARARYTAHLADCDQCRKIVTSIALAVNVAGEMEQPAPATTHAAVASASSWRTWLVALFAPPALRYGIPIVALLVAGAIFLAVMRSQQSQMYIAERAAKSESSRVKATRDNVSEPLSQIEPSTAPTEEANSAATQASPSIPAAVPERRQAESKQTIAPDAPSMDALSPDGSSTTAATSGASAPPSQQQSQDAFEEAVIVTQQQQQQQQQQANDEADSAGFAKSTVERQTRTTSATEAAKMDNKAGTKEKDASPSVNSGVGSRADLPVNNRRESVARLEERPVTNNVAGRNYGGAAARPPAKSEAEAPAKSRRRAAAPTDENRADSSAETRSVGGHRFRRQGGAWIDTTYNSSMGTTNVARGSEQYRALIADEPELRRIADQLGGEVVVVWKNRAYRIR